MGEQVKTKERLMEENKAIKQEKKDLVAQLESEQGNIGEYTENQAKMSAIKADLEIELEDRTKFLKQMEEERQAATEEKKVMESETNLFKKDIEDLELAIQKLEQEKTNRDHNIRFLNDEISNRDEVIKLNKEKKHVTENNSKAAEDLQVVEEKANHLNNVKSQLESTLDELEDSLTREKRSRAEVGNKSFQERYRRLRTCNSETRTRED